MDSALAHNVREEGSIQSVGQTGLWVPEGVTADEILIGARAASRRRSSFDLSRAKHGLHGPQSYSSASGMSLLRNAATSRPNAASAASRSCNSIAA